MPQKCFRRKIATLTDINQFGARELSVLNGSRSQTFSAPRAPSGTNPPYPSTPRGRPKSQPSNTHLPHTRRAHTHPATHPTPLCLHDCPHIFAWAPPIHGLLPPPPFPHPSRFPPLPTRRHSRGKTAPGWPRRHRRGRFAARRRGAGCRGARCRCRHRQPRRRRLSGMVEVRRTACARGDHRAASLPRPRSRLARRHHTQLPPP